MALGWDEQAGGGEDFDLDASMFLCNLESGKCSAETDFIFYNNLVHPSGAVKHTGDDKTGGASGDAEVIIVDLANMPHRISRMDVVVTIHDAVGRQQNFGQVRNAYVRLLDAEKDDKELLRFDLGEDFSVQIGVHFCRFYRKDDSWYFEAVGAGSNSDLGAFARDHGLDA